ncbi:hypothetical protein BN1708_019831, partial [Verticillium longisporum]
RHCSGSVWQRCCRRACRLRLCHHWRRQCPACCRDHMQPVHGGSEEQRRYSRQWNH